MSITQKDIQKLASLSRIQLTEAEEMEFAKEIDAILGYVDQINTVSTVQNDIKNPERFVHRNALREDVDDVALNPEPQILIDAAPTQQDGYVKVKKILN